MLSGVPAAGVLHEWFGLRLGTCGSEQSGRESSSEESFTLDHEGDARTTGREVETSALFFELRAFC